MHHLLEFLQTISTDATLMVHKVIDGVASLEQMADNYLRLKIVVHGIVTLLAKFFHHLFRLRITLVCSLNAVEIGNTVKQALQSFLGSLQRVVREVNRAAIVGRKDKEADGHGRIGLVKIFVGTRKELFQRDEVTQRLAHLLSVDGNHVVVHPVFHHVVALRSHTLGNLTFMMGEDKVHAAAMDVEMLTQILASHGRALTVPSGETVAPGRWPAHDMLFGCFLPEGEVGLVLLLAHSTQVAACVLNVLQRTSAQSAILVFLVVFLDVKIDTAVGFIGKTIVQNLLHQLLLLNDMTSGMGLNRRWQHVQRLHGLMVAVGIILRYLHRLQLF